MIPVVKSISDVPAGVPDKSSCRTSLRGFLPVVLAVFFLLFNDHSGAATIVYQQTFSNAFVTNYSGTSDTYIVAWGPDLNFGSELSMRFSTDERAGLLRFNLASFAGKYSRITGITLTLHIASISGVSQGELSAYTISPANAGWVAGIGGGTVQTGASTWNRRIHDTESWAGSAGLGTAGTDYNATKLGSFQWSQATDYDIHFSGTPAQLKALVDQWAGPQSFNAGIMLRNVQTAGTGTASVLAANTTQEQWSPKLTITYDVGPAIIVEQPAGTRLDNGSSSLDFGVSQVGSAGSIKTFTIRNDGIATLNSIVVSATGGNSADFTVGAPGVTTLAPGASTTFTVGFIPGGPAARSSTLRITSNDTTASPFNIGLTGSGWTTLQTWRDQYFHTINNSGEADNSADPDGDGLKNFMEFALGLNPTVFNNQGALSLQVNPAGVVTLSFKRARPANEVTYTVEASPNMSTWSDYAVNPGTVGQDAVLMDNVTTAPLRFFNLNVEIPP